MQKLSPYQTEIIALTLMHGNPDAAERLARTGTADLSYSLPSRARFRVNIFQQRGVYSIVMRVIPTDIPTLKIAGLPSQLATSPSCATARARDWSDRLRQELHAGRDHRHHQREEALPRRHDRGSDRVSPQSQTLDDQPARSRSRHARLSLGAARDLRQAPKVILIGEMRDFETTEIALEAAETGHLVLSTLHTIDASKTVDRIIGSIRRTKSR
jgi:twitching motility protein PilT